MFSRHRRETPAAFAAASPSEPKFRDFCVVYNGANLPANFRGRDFNNEDCAGPEAVIAFA